MGKYISSIKDLVILVMTNGSHVIYKANSGEPESCFQVGMMHLLGINTPVDFKKASHYFSNQSLAGDQEANLLLAFIAECEGEYSKAFCQYAKTVSSETDTYIDKVIKGRNNLQDYLKKQNLPISLNKEISSILSNYGKGKSSRTGACTKIAAICNDEPTSLEVAKCLLDAKDYISAIDWLKRGKVEPNDSMFKTINKKLKESTLDLLNSKDLQVINLESSSLLSKDDPTPFLNKVKQSCDEESIKCLTEWKEKNQFNIGNIIKVYKDQEQKAYLASLAEEAEAKKKKQRMYIVIGVAILLLLGLFMTIIPSSDKESNKDVQTIEEQSKATESEEASSNAYDQPRRKEENKQEKTPIIEEGAVDNGSINSLSERRLVEEDLVGKAKKELEIMRNSIYARYGYKFKREDLLDYFSQYSWYNPITNDMGAIYNKMNDIEKYNVDFIKKHE
jgi:hypothetical protein